MNKNKNLKRNLLVVLSVVIAIIVIAVSIILGNAYKPQDTANESLKSDNFVTVNIDGDITFTPNTEEATKGFILYPGAMVEPEAYAPLARKIAEEGYEVIITKMPLNFAVLSSNAAERVIEKYDNIDSWVIGGHSLGGVMAARFASENKEVDGVVLLASYPQGDELKNLDIDVLSIWGDKDGVLSFDNLEESKENLPKNTEYLEITGGNHALFGDYGIQDGDNEADITLEDQTTITADAILNLLRTIE